MATALPSEGYARASFAPLASERELERSTSGLDFRARFFRTPLDARMAILTSSGFAQPEPC